MTEQRDTIVRKELSVAISVGRRETIRGTILGKKSRSFPFRKGGRRKEERTSRSQDDYIRGVVCFLVIGATIDGPTIG